MAPGLEDHALAVLQQAQADLLEPGQIFWLPPEYDRYREREPKEAPWLVAAVEGRGGARAHIVPGTSKTATGPALIVKRGEANLPKRTEFDFSLSYALPSTTLVAVGQLAGDIGGRLDELERVIRAGDRVALKRLLDG